MATRKKTQDGNSTTHADIARRAFEIYMAEGCPPDRELDHWCEAEASLRAEQAQPKPTQRKKAAAKRGGRSRAKAQSPSPAANGADG